MLAPFELLAVLAGFVTLLLAGAMAGVYFAFQISVMPALGSVPAPAAIASMRAINSRIQNRWFFGAFFGTPFAALVAGALLAMIERPGPGYAMFGAGAVYLLGSLMPTLVVNVPLNLGLDRAPVPASEAEAEALWRRYSLRWTRWNAVRGIAAGAALALAGFGLLLWA